MTPIASNCQATCTTSQMDRFARRSSSSAPSCKAACMPKASLAATATIHTAATWWRKATGSAGSAITPPATMSPPTTIMPPDRRAVPASIATCRHAPTWVSIRAATMPFRSPTRACRQNSACPTPARVATRVAPTPGRKEKLRDWGVAGEEHWARLSQRLHRGDPAASDALYALVAGDTPPMVKASLLAQAAALPSHKVQVLLELGLRDSEPLVRRGAIAGAQGQPPAERWRLLAPHMNDPVASVRFETAIALADIVPALPAKALATTARPLRRAAPVAGADGRPRRNTENARQPRGSPRQALRPPAPPLNAPSRSTRRPCRP